MKYSPEEKIQDFSLGYKYSADTTNDGGCIFAVRGGFPGPDILLMRMNGDGDYLYVAFGDGFPGETLGVKIIDASSSINLQIVSTYLTGEFPPTSVLGYSDTLFVTTRETLYVLDISDRTQPQEVGSLFTGRHVHISLSHRCRR